MKKAVFLSVFLLISGFGSLWSEENNNPYFSFSITPQFEVANGVIKEYVFNDDCKNIDNKVSQLDWNIKTIALFGLEADFDILRYLSLGLEGRLGVPQRSDFIQDYDWQNSTTTVWKDQDPTELTNFSEHINNLDKYLDFKARLGANIYLPAKITISPYIAYQYEFIRFTGSGGYKTYKEDNWNKVDFTGKIISYEQEKASFLLGLGLYLKCIPKTSIKIDFDISPKTTTVNAIDYHYVKQYGSGIAYLDSCKHLFQIESEMTTNYCFTNNHSAGLSARIQYIPLSSGKTYTRNIDNDGNFLADEWTYSDNGYYGGTERLIWTIGLNYSFSL